MGRLLVLLSLVGCARPGLDASVKRTDDGGTTEIAMMEPFDGGLAVLRASATAFHWDTAWNAPAAQSISRPMIDRFLATRVGTVLLEHEWAGQDALSEPDDLASTAFYDSKYRLVLEDVLSHGGTVLIQLAGPPRWASSSTRSDPIVPGQNNRPIWSVAPPSSANDHAAWKRAVTTFASWLSRTQPMAVERGRVLLAYGAELNNEEFFGDLSLYAPAWNAFAEAARRVDPRFRLGGGGKLDGVTPKSKPSANQTTEPVLATWLRGCRALSCRIDFVLGHNFTMSPIRWDDDSKGARDDFEALAQELEAIAAPHGYGHLPIVLTDWTSWEFKDRTRHPWLSSEHDTEYRAAHLTASLLAMARAGYAGQTQGALFETVSSISDEFSGDWGLFSRRGITKASFHATELVSRLSEGAPSSYETNDRFLSALLVTEGPTRRLVLARFVPDTEHGARMLVESLGARLLSQGYDEAKLNSLGCPTSSLQRLAATLDRSQCSAARPPLSTTLDAWFELLRAAQVEPLERTVRVHLPWAGPVPKVRVATIDATHSNPGPGCGASGCSDIAATNAGAGALAEVEVPVVLGDGGVEVELGCGLREVVLVTVSP